MGRRNPTVHWTHEDIVMGCQVLDMALSSRYGPGVHRGELRRVRDALYAIIILMEVNGTETTEADRFYAIFDALAHITFAMRWRGIHVSSLREGRKCLGKLRKLEEHE